MKISRFVTQRVRQPRQHVKSDPQRYRLYFMERTLLGNIMEHQCKSKYIQAIVDRACDNFCVPPAAVSIVHRPKIRIWGWQLFDRLTFNRGFGGCNIHIVLHEVAHYITDELTEGADGVQNHGPEFVGVYRALMDQFNVIPNCAFDALCSRWNLKWVEVWI